MMARVLMCVCLGLMIAPLFIAPLFIAPQFVVGSEPETPAPNIVAKSQPVVSAPAPHCEVPCGIYQDQRRFEELLEDQQTIEKAINSINEAIAGMENGPPTATVLNQSVRWVTTKEDHATNVQHIVSQYFLTQRIKADNKDYVKQLAAAHSVMVSAMKCKQDANLETAVALKKAIYALYTAYEGKEPTFEQDAAKKSGDGSGKK